MKLGLTVSTWRWPHLLLLWAGILVAGCLLTWMEIARRDQFFYLIPYQGGLRGAWRFIRFAFTAFPFAATGWIALPCLALVVTLWWLILQRDSGISRSSI